MHTRTDRYQKVTSSAEVNIINWTDMPDALSTVTRRMERVHHCPSPLYPADAEAAAAAAAAMASAQTGVTSGAHCAPGRPVSSQ